MSLAIQADPNSQWIKKAIWLSWFTIGYNLIEGLVSIGFGISEGSIALAGFGVDSWIEVASAILVLWRFRAESQLHTPLSLQRERKATFGIALLFIMLALLTAGAGIIQIASGEHPETTLPGIIISTLSLSFMFFLWRAKVGVATALNSLTVMKDASCSLACIHLSIVLFVGSLIFYFFPDLWWVDAAAAIILSVFIGREGWETLEAARNPDFSGGCGCGPKDCSQ